MIKNSLSSGKDEGNRRGLMDFRGRSLYNMMRINAQENEASEYKNWEIRDYRSMTVETIFEELETLGVYLEEESFKVSSDECDTPEELAECFFEEDLSREQKIRIYLLIFELWRRLNIERQTLSIFCDELDHVIEAYEENQAGSEERLVSMLSDLENILDQSVDHHKDPPEKIFEAVKQFCCHDLEVFIYDFISIMIDQANETYASELVDAFLEYFREKNWLKFLRIRLISSANLQESKLLLDRLLEDLEEKPDFDLYLEILRYLIYLGDTQQFRAVFEVAMTLLKTEDDLTQLLTIALEYFSCIEKPEQEQYLRAALAGREALDLNTPLDRESPAYYLLKDFLLQALSLQNS